MPPVTVNDLNNAKLDCDTIAAAATSQAPTVTDRLGNTKNTLSGMNAAVLASAAAVQGSIGYLPPVAYAAGISLTLAAQTVGYSGQTYAPILSALPFTTSGTFETAKFRLIQGVAGADLAAPTGADLVVFTPLATSAISRKVSAKLQEIVSVFDFMTVAQILDVQARTMVLDHSPSVATAIANTGNGQTLYFPAGTYNVNQIFTSSKSINIIGSGRGTVFSIPDGGVNILFYLGGAVINGTPNPGYPGLVSGFGTDALTRSQKVFNFSSVAGLTVGDEVLLNMGIDPFDGGQHYSRSFNKIQSITGLSVTMAQGIPEAVAAFPSSPGFAFSPTFHECVKFTNGVPKSVTVGNFSIAQGTGTVSDPVIMIMRIKKPILKDIWLNDAKASIYLQECDNPTIQSIYAEKVRGGFISIAGCRSIAASNLLCQKLVGTGIYLENQCRGGIFDLLTLVADDTKQPNAFLTALGGSTGISVRNLTIENVAGAPNAQALVVQDKSDVTVDRATLNDDINVYSLKNHLGPLVYRGYAYKSHKKHRLVIALQPNMAYAEFRLPIGFTKMVKANIASKTGVTRLALVNYLNQGVLLIDRSNSVDFFQPSGVFGPLTTDFAIMLGTDNAFGFNRSPLLKRVQISTDSTTVPGTLLIFETETIGPDLDDGVNGESNSGIKGDFIGFATVTPGSIPAGGQYLTNVSTLNARMGDPVFSGFSAYLGGCSISTSISGNGIAEVIISNRTAANVTLGQGVLTVSGFSVT